MGSAFITTSNLIYNMLCHSINPLTWIDPISVRHCSDLELMRKDQRDLLTPVYCSFASFFSSVVWGVGPPCRECREVA